MGQSRLYLDSIGDKMNKHYGKHISIDDKTEFNIGMKAIYENTTPWSRLPKHTDKLKLRRPRYLLIMLLNYYHKESVDRGMQLLAECLIETERILFKELSK